MMIIHIIYTVKKFSFIKLSYQKKIHNISALIAINVLIVLLFQIIKNYKIQFNEGSLMKLPEHQKNNMLKIQLKRNCPIIQIN